MNKKTIEMYFGSPLYQAFFSNAVFETGMGSMVISRRTVGGVIVGVVFLCDHYCLGVKDCYAFGESEAGYRTLLNQIGAHEYLREVDASTLKTYILGLVQWARQIGFQPAPDYRFCAQILQGIQENPDAKFEYGKDGVPFYINGPNDSPARIREIVGKLTAYQQRTGQQVHFSLIGPVVNDLPAELIQQSSPDLPE